MNGTSDGRFVVDACVVVKWFVPEELREQALRVGQQQFELIAPDVMTGEVANVLLQKSRSHEMAAPDIRPALDLVADSVESFNSSHLRDEALAIAVQYRRSYFDALYVAFAIEQSCRLLTSDRRLLDALKEAYPSLLYSLAHFPLT